MVQISKTASNIHFNEAETDRELIFQKLFCKSILKMREPRKSRFLRTNSEIVGISTFRKIFSHAELTLFI